MSRRPQIFDSLSALSDPTRSRLLLALEGRELTVSELCAVVQLPQSTVSRHLKVLGDGGWVLSRPDGTRRLYRCEIDRLDDADRRLWRLVKEQASRSRAAREDLRRLGKVLAERRTRSQAFFSSAAGRWDRLRQDLFGARSEVAPLLGLLDDSWVVGDLGCGTGRTAEAVAPFVRRVIGVDSSEAMLAAARARLQGFDSIDLRQGDLEALPVADGELDAALLVLVLHHLSDPAEAFREVARTLRPGGRLLVVDMLPHERGEYRQEMGHQWLGFTDEQLAGWMAGVGLELRACRPLPPDPQAKGPALFAATGQRRRGVLRFDETDTATRRAAARSDFNAPTRGEPTTSRSAR